jgi:uncharacterized protein (DUF1501 family)
MSVHGSRREFLKSAILGTCGAAVHTLSAPFAMQAWAQASSCASSNSLVMILINFAGGASYNVAPLYDGAYRDLNPTVSYGPENSLVLDNNQGLHPSFTALKSAWDEGNLALINMVGYPNPNRSHAESTDIWFAGKRDMAGIQEGWAARLTCQLGTTFAGVSLGGSNLLVQGSCNPPRSIQNLDSLGERYIFGNDVGSWIQFNREEVIKAGAKNLNPNHTYVKSQMDNLAASLEKLRSRNSVPLPTIANPFPQNSGFSRACRDAARLIAANDLGVKFIYLERGGFDTHSMEKPALTNNLNDINGGLRSLIQTLKAINRWQDTVIVTMSEFCRTFENGSEGTDHGHAGPMFVLGGGVKGGIKSPQPSRAETSANIGFYRNYYVDFRHPLKEILDAMGCSTDPIFPGYSIPARLNLI